MLMAWFCLCALRVGGGGSLLPVCTSIMFSLNITSGNLVVEHMKAKLGPGMRALMPTGSLMEEPLPMSTEWNELATFRR